MHTAVERMRFAAGLAYEIKGETIPSTPGNIHMTIRQPYGVIGRIIPFNHPIGFAASRIAPAIISGNTHRGEAIGAKPACRPPSWAKSARQVLPPGVVNIVTGGRETGEALVRHPRVKRIAFIGQPAVGHGDPESRRGNRGEIRHSGIGRQKPADRIRGCRSREGRGMLRRRNEFRLAGSILRLDEPHPAA